MVVVGAVLHVGGGPGGGGGGGAALAPSMVSVHTAVCTQQCAVGLYLNQRHADEHRVRDRDLNWLKPDRKGLHLSRRKGILVYELVLYNFPPDYS